MPNLPSFIPIVSLAKIAMKAIGGAFKKLKKLKTSNKKLMLMAGKAPDKGGLSAAGRAAQKHGSRAGSFFPPVKGNPATMSAQGEKILEGIINHPNAQISNRIHPKFGAITEVRIPGGQGARFTEDLSKLIGFLEP